MSHIFNFFIVRWRVSFSLTIFGMILGYFGLMGMNKQAFPPVNTGNVVITSIYPGSSAEEAKDEVTRIIEDQIKGVTGIKDVTSISQNGLSRIILRVDIDSFNYRDVFDDVQKAVNKAGPLPESLLGRPTVQEIKSEEMPVLLMSISGKGSSRDLDATAKKVKDTLELLKDVARVDLTGYTPREFQIQLDPKKLDRWQMTVAEVVKAIRNSVKNVPAGNIEGDGKTTLVKIIGKTKSIEDLEATVIRSNFDGKSVTVGDVGSVRDVPRDKDSLVIVDNVSAVKATVIKKATSDTIKTVAGVKAKLVELKSQLPENTNLKVYDDEAKRVEAKLGIAINNAVIGFILVSIFLLIFFPSLAGVFTSFSLPIVVMLTLGIIPMLGADFNNITLLAIIISLGLLVDNAIVVGENFIRLRKTGMPAVEAAKEGVRQFWIPITATAFTTIAAFVPMLVTKGVMGDFLKFIPYVVTTVLVVSLIESFILLPARLQFTMRKQKRASAKDIEQGGCSTGSGRIFLGLSTILA